uniref:P6 protein n=1 Tax=Barley yellow dwarf virus-PAS TaxID=2169985 RepID=A0A650E6N0_9TOMB|nr:P6 protein [Barley yellow dwarf virus PAS]
MDDLHVIAVCMLISTALAASSLAVVCCAGCIHSISRSSNCQKCSLFCAKNTQKYRGA